MIAKKCDAAVRRNPEPAAETRRRIGRQQDLNLTLQTLRVRKIVRIGKCNEFSAGAGNQGISYIVGALIFFDRKILTRGSALNFSTSASEPSALESSQTSSSRLEYV